MLINDDPLFEKPKRGKSPPVDHRKSFFRGGGHHYSGVGRGPEKTDNPLGRSDPTVAGGVSCLLSFRETNGKTKNKQKREGRASDERVACDAPAPSRHASYLSPLSLSRISKQASKQATKRPFSYYTTYIGRSDRALGAASSSVVSSTRGRRRRERDYSATFAQTVTIIYWRNFGFRFELSS